MGRTTRPKSGPPPSRPGGLFPCTGAPTMDRFTKAIEDWLQALQPLFRGLVAHPVLLLVALLFLAVAWGWVGRAYGLTALFWHKSIGTQFLNGLGVSLLFAALCFVAYLR